ncbi:AMIN-like domain-containing (lipo)protein [Cumulibacter manganitolerans]|uniref:AMIN-like domain-containing (lipo)protein n=1 Tax=Cumulibacter manganitolerans TaxID=1884992 RepID=UPI001886202E|nr:hypothetical protein [Cumulibacter manganitolerans]
MRRTLTWLMALITAVGIGLITPAVAQAAPYCGIYWGSLPKAGGSLSSAPITNVRAGRHTCYDRVVVDISGSANGYQARYVPVVTAEGSGAPIPLRGGAYIQLVILDPAYSSSGASTYHPSDPANLVNVSGWQTLRQIAWGGSYEGYTTIAIGVRARLPFRVFVLTGPTRIVLDVAHYW